MRRRNTNRNTYKTEGVRFAPFFAAFFLIVLRFLYFGFVYFPQLDDYIQYHNYAALGTPIYVIGKLGLLAARPLAGVLDVTLWSGLWHCLIVGLLFLCVLYALAAEKLYRLFARLFGTSAFFVVLLALAPLGIEGTYWLSAATRIVPGLLFAALSAERFEAFLHTEKKCSLAAAFLLQLLTFGFYEQTAVLSCALNLLLAFCIPVQDKKCRWFGWMGFVSAGVYFALCKLAGPSALYDGRTQLVSVLGAEYWRTFIPEVLSQLRSVFLGGGYYLLVYGLLRGFLRIFADGAWLYVLLLLFGCILFSLSHKANGGKRKIVLPILAGVYLTLAAVLPYFFIANPWISFRAAVPALPGIALVSDAFVRLLLGRTKKGISVLCAVMAFLFCICSVSELADYRDNYESDQRIVGTVADLGGSLHTGDRVMLLNVDDTYVSEQNCKYHEHIRGVTESAWALTGAVRCAKEDVYEGVTYIPVSLRRYTDGVIYRAWEFEEKSLGGMTAVYWYDPKENAFAPLQTETVGDGVYLLYFADGKRLGSIVEKENIGYFTEE